MDTEKIKPGDVVILNNNTLFSYVVISIDYNTGMALCATPIEWEKEFPLKSLKKIAKK